MKIITLRSRIIILLTTFTVIIISIFISVQLSYVLDTINKFKKSQSSIISLALENTWERILTYNLPEERNLEFVGKKLSNIKAANEFKKAYVLNKQARIVFSTEKGLQGQEGDFNDKYIIEEMKNKEPLSGKTLVDKNSRQFSIYIFLKNNGKTDFVARIFFSLADLRDAYQLVYRPAFLMGILIIFANIILGVFLSRLLIGPIRIFNNAAKVIASGRLDLRVNISTSDELEELASTFNSMTEELIKMKECAENANPLTKLPGNILIREEVEQRIREEKKFTVIYCDLDNFKAFNDNYGIAKGDEAIKLVGEISKETIKAEGNSDDFIGHEGGDDFILLTTPEKAKIVADSIIASFDAQIRMLYNEQDLKNGFITAQSRNGAIQQFPIMTISLAGVSNEKRSITSYAEVTNIAAELKKKAKKENKSCFILDMRGN